MNGKTFESITNLQPLSNYLTANNLWDTSFRNLTRIHLNGIADTILGSYYRPSMMETPKPEELIKRMEERRIDD